MADAWPQAGYDGGNTSYNPDATGVPNGLDRRHDPPYLGGGEVESVVVTPGEYVVATREGVFGVDRAGGDPVWSKRVELGGSVAPVVRGPAGNGAGGAGTGRDAAATGDAGEVVVLHDGVHGFEPAADRAEWHRSVPDAGSRWRATGPTLDADGETAVFGTLGGSEGEIGDLFAVDLTDRTVEHLRPTNYGVGARPLVADATVVCVSGPAYPTLATSVEAFDSDGTPRWRHDFERAGAGGTREGGVAGLHLLGNGRAYAHVTDRDGPDEAVAYDLTGGSVDWRRSFGLDHATADAALVRDYLLLADDDRVLAVNSHTGDVIWEHDRRDGGAGTGDGTDAGNGPGSGGDPPGTTLVATLDVLCVGGERPVGLDPETGRRLWTHDEPLAVRAVVDDELVAVRPRPDRPGSDLLVFGDAGEGGNDTAVFPRCPDCGTGLAAYDDPGFCPECGTELD